MQKEGRKRYNRAKLDREMYRQRVLGHVAQAISCSVHRHEKGKLLKRFCRWKVIVEKRKTGERDVLEYFWTQYSVISKGPEGVAHHIEHSFKDR